jgi:DNA-3-methyladenine glycosylase II
MLSVSLNRDKKLKKDDVLLAMHIVKSIFNLDLKLNIFYHDIEKDKIISVLTEKLTGLKSPTTSTFFEAIVFSIIEQQISLKATRSIKTE